MGGRTWEEAQRPQDPEEGCLNPLPEGEKAVLRMDSWQIKIWAQSKHTGRSQAERRLKGFWARRMQRKGRTQHGRPGGFPSVYGGWSPEWVEMLRGEATGRKEVASVVVPWAPWMQPWRSSLCPKGNREPRKDVFRGMMLLMWWVGVITGVTVWRIIGGHTIKS